MLAAKYAYILHQWQNVWKSLLEAWELVKFQSFYPKISDISPLSILV